jgi:tRNA pseudouridine38-40 synthase
MRRIRLKLSYDGTDYHGWQVQPGLPTIQGLLQGILSEMEGDPVHVTGSGRTDAGVHAFAQVAAFNFRNPIPPDNLRRALNRLLPHAVRIVEVQECAPGFHPRYDAKAKTYEYRIYHGEVCSPFERRFIHHHPYPLDLDGIRQAAPLLEGEHDFSAFAAADERDALGHSKVREIFLSEFIVNGDYLTYRVRGSGFLKHMVRNIAGTLLEAGKGNLTPNQIMSFFEPGSRKAGPRLPARGLFLMSVEY